MVGPKLSAPNDLRQLPAQDQDVKKASKSNVETNTAFCMGNEKAKVNDRVPMSELLLLDGFLDEKRVRVLKDDGCNTNVMSYEFFKKNKNILRWENCKVEVRHSKSGSIENSSIIVLGATLKIETHKYRSNWIVADCRYDLLLGMPWHVSNNPLINYQKRTIILGKEVIKVQREKKKTKCRDIEHERERV